MELTIFLCGLFLLSAILVCFTVYFKKVLLGALYWYLIFTFLYFATVYAGIQHYAFKAAILLAAFLEVPNPVELGYIPVNIFFAFISLPCVLCASGISIVLIEGRRCSFKEFIAATLSWLWWMIATVIFVVLWTNERYIFPFRYSQLKFNIFLTNFAIRESWIAVPTALLGAFTYWGLRAWFPRKQIEDNS